jgi:hypothetical protein
MELVKLHLKVIIVNLWVSSLELFGCSKQVILTQERKLLDAEIELLEYTTKIEKH